MCMYCKKCGTEMGNSARFCHMCGYDSMGEETHLKKKINMDSEIKFQVKTKFNISYELIQLLPIAIYCTVIVFCVFLYCKRYMKNYYVVLLSTLSIMLLCIIIEIIIQKVRYKKINYNFYTTRVEYCRDFLGEEEKELSYKNVKEVVMHQNVIEKIFNIGTIKIYTNASGKDNGIHIYYVENVQQQYKIIKQIIDDGILEE